MADHDTHDHTGIPGVTGTPSDILDIPTAEMDDTLVLAPDGAGGVEFRAEAGGGGGGGRGEYADKYNPDNETPATTPDFADEFNGSIDGGWSWSTTPAVTDATGYPGFYQVQTSGTGDHWLSRAFAPGATDLTIAAKLSLYNIANANTPFVDIGFGGATGATPAEAVMFRIQAIAGNTYQLQAVDRTGGGEAGNTARSSPVVGQDISRPMWIRMTRLVSGPTWSFYYSLDGITWSPVAYLGTRSKSLTVAAIFVRMASQSLSLTLDWIRVWDSIVVKVGD